MKGNKVCRLLTSTLGRGMLKVSFVSLKSLSFIIEKGLIYLQGPGLKFLSGKSLKTFQQTLKSSPI